MWVGEGEDKFTNALNTHIHTHARTHKTHTLSPGLTHKHVRPLRHVSAQIDGQTDTEKQTQTHGEY